MTSATAWVSTRAEGASSVLGPRGGFHSRGRRALLQDPPAPFDTVSLAFPEAVQQNRQRHPDETFVTYVGLARGYAAMGDTKNAIANWETAPGSKRGCWDEAEGWDDRRRSHY